MALVLLCMLCVLWYLLCCLPLGIEKQLLEVPLDYEGQLPQGNHTDL